MISTTLTKAYCEDKTYDTSRMVYSETLTMMKLSSESCSTFLKSILRMF